MPLVTSGVEVFEKCDSTFSQNFFPDQFLFNISHFSLSSSKKNQNTKKIEWKFEDFGIRKDE